MVTETIGQLYANVARGRGESSLTKLFETLELPGELSTLEKVALVSDQLKTMGLRLVPDISRGELDSIRRVVFDDPIGITEETIREELRDRENCNLELKSSLLYDHQKALAFPKLTLQELKSEAVLHSSLKTVAAFLNSTGGILYIGVNDAGTLLGIKPDYLCMTTSPQKQNADHWELIFRSYIRDKFKDGTMVNNYVDCQIIELNELPIARIALAPRNTLSFVKEKDAYLLYRRQGNQTVQIPIDQVEEFLEMRKTLFA